MAGGDHRRGVYLPPAPAAGAYPADTGAGGYHGLHLPGKDPSGGAFHLPPASGSPAPVPHRPTVCAAGRGAGPRQRRHHPADAFDADGLLLTGGCADPYGWKAVRSSMGAVFRRPIYFGSPEELAALLHRSGLPLYGAALREDTVDARQADYTRCVLAIGSEGRGLSREVLDLCGQTIRIPMSDRCESLNAAIAAAVLLWESWR